MPWVPWALCGERRPRAGPSKIRGLDSRVPACLGLGAGLKVIEDGWPGIAGTNSCYLERGPAKEGIRIEEAMSPLRNSDCDSVVVGRRLYISMQASQALGISRPLSWKLVNTLSQCGRRQHSGPVQASCTDIAQPFASYYMGCART